MKIVGIIQARMGSTRLPGKVMKEVNGKSLLEYQIERLKEVQLIDDIIIATTTRKNDDCIVDFCEKQNITVHRGSEENVLERYYFAATESNANLVVRMTSDCPLIDPAIVDKMIMYYLTNDFDYVSNTIIRSYPRGMDAEIFSYVTLKEAYSYAEKDYEKEHVTPYIYLNPEKYRIGQMINEKNSSQYRLTVDVPEDFVLISTLIETLYIKNKMFDLDMILKEMNEKPYLSKINGHVKQKALGDK